MLEFDKFGIIKPKIYLLDYEVEEDNWRLIIMIEHKRYTFLANDGVCKI